MNLSLSAGQPPPAGRGFLHLTASGSSGTSGSASITISAAILQATGTLTAEGQGLSTVGISRATSWNVEALERPNIFAQVWKQLDDMSLTELIALFLYLRDQVIDTLANPNEALYGTLMTLPLLAFVIRAIRRREGGR